MRSIKTLCIFGTRPEATKMAPLVKALEACESFTPAVCVTGQHRQQLDQVLTVFGITPDYDLDIMIEGQDLAHVTTSALVGLMEVIAKAAPDIVLVHGDTATTLAACLAAYYSRVKLGHVEAGLRTGDKYAPYPEEINRRIAAVCADLNFAPTQTAKQNLLREGINPQSIYVTGNTAIDAINSLVAKDYVFKEQKLNKIDFVTKRIITLTAHRRENYGEPFENIFRAVTRLAADFSDVEFVYPVHLSPAVRSPVRRLLEGNPKIHLTEPVDVEDLLNLLARSCIALTDSGGIQEEAPHLNIPVLVLRNVTERPEGLEAGCLALAGTEENSVYQMAKYLLTSEVLYQKMAAAKNPFGDGQAAGRIVKAVLHHFGLAARPDDYC